MRTPIELADHQRSPVIAAPFRLLDCCLESDGACALVVSGPDRARDLPAPAVRVATWAMGSGPRPGYGYDGFFTWDEPAELYAHYVGPQLWSRAEVGPADVDVASIYDCFTFSVLTQLEGFGFCGPGEASDFVREGRADYGGDVVVNPHGGMLSEAYVHGLNGVVEIVQQLRGAAGERQVPGAAVALATGFGTTAGCGLVLTR